ncbi:MAG TPA: Lrp/AsnC family transcriptional regulator [archaeon]|nr:Lrp/AsnC family transcriptional regulator [archaeon]HRT02455.1 Lrp/AsnC family transcriptional regulator [Candidatus Diapherotrites archaeon]
MQVIDKIDKHIIEQLIVDGRMTFANIAKDINLTDVAIKKRLDRLKQKGIIKNIYAEIDYKVIGFTEDLIVLINAEPTKTNNVIKKLNDIDNIIKLYGVTGEYNLVAQLIAEDKENLQELLNSINTIDGILKITILTVLKEYKNSKNVPNKIIQTTF